MIKPFLHQKKFKNTLSKQKKKTCSTEVYDVFSHVSAHCASVSVL